jgi:hypothetical protein
VIAIALEHGDDVAFGPLIEVAVVAIDRSLTLGSTPFIEGFIHDQEPHPVEQVQQLRRWWVMTEANGIAAHLL